MISVGRNIGLWTCSVGNVWVGVSVTGMGTRVAEAMTIGVSETSEEDASAGEAD